MIQQKRWARDYAACVRCGNSERKHFGHGLCRICYMTDYNAANLASVQKMKRESYLRRGGKLMAKLQREERHYGGKREQVLKRDGYKCQQCQRTDKLVVHHKDNNGRGCPKPNNELKNLVTLCRKCHLEAHRQQVSDALRASPIRGNNQWKRKAKV